MAQMLVHPGLTIARLKGRNGSHIDLDTLGDCIPFAVELHDGLAGT